jgi:hypothetical protein
VFTSVLFLGCVVPPLTPGDPGVDAGVQGPTFTDLQVKLDAHRTEFLPRRTGEQFAVGNRLFWLESSTFIPTLHSVEATSGARVNYGFSVGIDGSNYAFKASEQLVATVTKSGDQLTYHAYSATAANQLLGEFQVAGPLDEQRWWAFCVEGDRLYFADNLGGGHVFAWRPGDAAPREVLALAAAGINLGILLEFGVEAGQLVLLESGRLWAIDLASGRGRWLGNHKEADEVSFDASGILFRTEDGLFFEDAKSLGTLRNVTQELLSTPSPVPEREWGHRDDGEVALLRRGQLIYIGWSGVFVDDLATGAVRAVLLEPSFADTGERVDYRDPQVTDDGSLFVTGLVSTSGSLGADGPIFRVTGWR